MLPSGRLLACKAGREEQGVMPMAMARMGQR
jgi:hypothetical protein